MTEARIACALVVAIALLLCVGCGSSPQPKLSYKNDVVPIIRMSCRCHVDNQTPPGRLDLGSREKMMQGGAQGREVVPGSPDSSILYSSVVRGDMPPNNPLAREDIRVIRKWIEQGAKDN